MAERKVGVPPKPKSGEGSIPRSLDEAFAEWERAVNSPDPMSSVDREYLMARVSAGLSKDDERLLYKKVFGALGVLSSSLGLES